MKLTAQDRLEWAHFQNRNRRARFAYPARVVNAARPGCAYGCGRAVWSDGGVCVPCRKKEVQ